MTASTEQERADFLAWIRTHENEHGAVDEASAWAAWSARGLEQAARRAPAVPQGWKLVPEEPTPAMIDAHALGSVRVLPAYVGAKEKAYERLVERYKAMLAAAPNPPEAECSKCGQRDFGQTGEYPCQACGLPTVHDENVPPVQLPEPCCRVSVDEDGEFEVTWRGGFPPDDRTRLYTEQQVRQLLATR